MSIREFERSLVAEYSGKIIAGIYSNPQLFQRYSSDWNQLNKDGKASDAVTLENFISEKAIEQACSTARKVCDLLY